MATIWVWRFRWYSGLKAAWEGRRHGRAGKPLLDLEDYSDYEYELKQNAEQVNRGVAEKWTELDRGLLREFCDAKAELASAAAAVEPAERESIRASQSFAEQKEKVEQTGGVWYLPKVAYFPLISLVGLIELPVNAIVFQVLGGTTLETYLYTLIPAVLLMLGAHFLGQSLKMDPSRLGRFVWMPRLAFVFTTLMLIFLMIVAYFRSEFIAQVAEQLVGVKLNQLVVTVMFGVVNVLLVTLATWLSFLSHDPMIEEMLKAQNFMLRCQLAFNEAKHRLDRAKERLQRATTNRQATHKQHVEIAEQFKNEAQRLMSIYRKWNRYVRNDGDPACFKKGLPEIGTYVPAELAWECGQS